MGGDTNMDIRTQAVQTRSGLEGAVADKQYGRGLYRNAVSYFGLLIVVLNAALIALSMLASLTISQPSPYLGIFTYLLFPGFLVLGLLVVVAGMHREGRRRRRLKTQDALPFPRLDLNDPQQRRRFGYVLVVGTLLAILLALTGYKGFLFTESVTFCGKTCHTVMRPEYTAYGFSPHARVACVDCHVGEGAGWYVKSKLSGARQVLAVTFHTYQKPIPVPIRDLRPARETCEQCHWPQKFYGAKLLQLPHFRYNESNSAEQITLMVRTGGGTRTLGQNAGIHWHMIIDNTVTFSALDAQLQDIPWVSVRHSDGSATEYAMLGVDVSPSKRATMRTRAMDCMDCHNRPTHGFPPPDGAIDTALYSNLLPTSLPWIKKVLVEALIHPYPSVEAAHDGIHKAVFDYYQSHYPRVFRDGAADLSRAAQVAASVYDRGVFPEMRVDWKTYPENIGHRNWPGCFRCHDGRHVSKQGRVLTMNCDVCHTQPQRGPLASLGTVPSTIEPDWHPWDLSAKHLTIDAHKNVLCSACHQAGAMPRKECSDCHK
jgi:hypothetical protein